MVGSGAGCRRAYVPARTSEVAAGAWTRHGLVPTARKGERSMSIITILIIVLVVLLVAGFLGRGRF
jgi:hypothetical protein